MPFVFYYIAVLFLMPFQGGVPLNIMMNSWRVSIMSTLFLPFVMWNVMRYDKSSIKLFRNTVLIGISVAIGYGLLLTTMSGLNPYIMLMPLENDIDMARYYEAADTGRMFGRISSVFIQPMTFALFIGLSFIYLFYIKENIKKTILIILLGAVTIMALLCGVRSVLGGLAVAIFFYFFIEKNYKYFFCGSIIIGIFYVIISQIPELSSYLSSLVDVNDKQGNVTGSSFDMRINQLYGAIDIAQKNPLFGLGYEWTNYYQIMKGHHPVCLAFESLIFMIICNHGIFGFLIWTMIIFKYFDFNKRFRLKNTTIVNSLMVFYISYACITGEYGYMSYFLIFYVLMLCENKIKKRII